MSELSVTLDSDALDPAVENGEGDGKKPSPTEVVLEMIREELLAPRVISGEAAERIFNTLEEEDPELLWQYLWEIGIVHIAETITRMMRAKRLATARASGRARFVEQGEIAMGGEIPEDLMHSRINANGFNEHVILKDCTAPELTHAAAWHERLADTNRMKAAFFRMLATLVGNQTVGEVLDETRLREIWLQCS
jgi:hypothetical protein